MSAASTVAIGWMDRCLTAEEECRRLRAALAPLAKLDVGDRPEHLVLAVVVTGPRTLDALVGTLGVYEVLAARAALDGAP